MCRVVRYSNNDRDSDWFCLWNVTIYYNRNVYDNKDNKIDYNHQKNDDNDDNNHHDDDDDYDNNNYDNSLPSVSTKSAILFKL
jgi:hypothetical protein